MDSVLPLSNLPLFIPAALALIIAPGPVVMYIVTRSVSQGRRAGLVSVMGSELGNLCHAIAAALGLSAILMSSALAFDLVKYLGAAYLIYMGIRKLRSSNEAAQQAVKQEPPRRIFLQSLTVAILNPKTALFFLAFLPQFVDTSKGSVTAQILFLGLIFVAMATISDALYALTAGTAGRWLQGNLRYLRFQRYFSGTAFIGLGLVAALSGGSKK
jgi:threonine/homoserine/homoserine lactone efflux protein